LLPEGHHDFDENLISLQDYQDQNLNTQSDHPGRDEALEIRGEMARKFSEWFEYRVPNFSELEALSPDDLMSTMSVERPDLKDAIDELRSKKDDELLSKEIEEENEERERLTPVEGEPFAPEEIPEYTDLLSPKYYKWEEPVGTSGDVEELAGDSFDNRFEDLKEYWQQTA